MKRRTRPPWVLAAAVAMLAAGPSPGAAAAAGRTPSKAAALARSHADAARALDRARALRAGIGVSSGRELTPALAELAARYGALDPAEQRAADRLLARPTDPVEGDPGHAYTVAEHAPYCTTHFCLHWVTSTVDAPDLTDANGTADGDGVPDYVETMGDEFEYVQGRENGDLGWRTPVADGTRGGDARLDVYLIELSGTGVLGYAATDATGQPADPHTKFAYMVMDDDYAGLAKPPLDMLRVTAAHEYNHVLQFAYDALEDSWMFESTAVWMEDRVWDGVDAYLGFIPMWAHLDEVPLAKTNKDKHYGSGVWNMWLDARHGPTLVRDAWNGSATATPASFAPAAYDKALVAGGHPGFAASFTTFAADVAEWRTATAFPEGAAYTDVDRRGNLAVAGAPVTPLLDHTTFAYYTVPEPGGGWPAAIRLDGELPAGVAGGLALVGRTGADPAAGTVTTSAQQLPAGGSGSVELTSPASFGRVTAVLVNADTDTTGFTGGDWTFAADAQQATATISPSDGTPAAPANVVPPSISGIPRDGEVLTGVKGVWSGSAPVSYARQWRRCDSAGANCTDIAGATGGTYTVVSDDIGHRLRFRVTASNSEGSASADSAATVTVIGVAPANTAAPTIDEQAPVVADTLNATTGTWTGSQPMNFTYQWRRCTSTNPATCVNVVGATSSAYTAAEADADNYLRVRVTATNSTGSAFRESATTAQRVAGAPPQNTALPTITGTARDGETLTASDGTWSGAPSLTRQWRRCADATPATCADIAGQTATTYIAQPADVGKRLRIRVHASNGAGTADADSAATAIVAAIAVANAAAPSISGTAVVGSPLSASDGTWTGTPPIALARRWQRCTSAVACTDVPGATGAAYTPTDADLLLSLRVVVTATNAGGTVEAASALAGPVLAAAGGPSGEGSGPGGDGGGGTGPGGDPGTGGAGGPSAEPPVLAATLKLPGSRAKLAVALAGRLTVDASCTAACLVTAKLTIDRAAARRLRIAAANPVAVASGAKRLAAAGTARVALKFTAKARKRLKGARKVAVQLRVDVRDAAGAVKASRRLRLTLAR